MVNYTSNTEINNKKLSNAEFSNSELRNLELNKAELIKTEQNKTVPEKTKSDNTEQKNSAINKSETNKSGSDNVEKLTRFKHKMYKALEFDKILEALSDFALSDKIKQKLLKLEPYMSESDVKRGIAETTQAKIIIQSVGTPPLAAMTEVEKILVLLGKNIMLMPEQLGHIRQFLSTCKRMKTYLKKAENTSAEVAYYGNSINDISELEDEIDRTIRGEFVDDRASTVLFDLRRKIDRMGEQIRAKLDSLLRNNKLWFSESYVTFRNGHYTLPVKKEYKSQVNGTVIDISQSGSTFFIEPTSARKFQEELNILQIEEDNEVRRILYSLTALVEDYLPLIKLNIEAMETLDYVFAKAKLSLEMKAIEVPVTADRKIVIKDGRHPLIKPEIVVPLDFNIDEKIHAVIITGPNTGGKTVALKTTGLLSLMAQSGLHVPAGEGSSFCMHNMVLCDIGDGQSITENLSTFSSHMTNIIEILKIANDQTLVLLDELGSGTDPAEGMGIAIAILEELSKKRCLLMATTHYPEIKEYAKDTKGFINARMAFDRQSLLPLYRLEIGEAGESCALYIAKRLGFPQNMLKRAYSAAYHGNKNIRPSNNYDFVEFDTRQSSRKDSKRGFEKMQNPLNDNEDSEMIPTILVDDGNSDVVSSYYNQRIKKQETNNSPAQPRSTKFNIGDSVLVYPQKMIGIVFEKADIKGEIGVQIKDRKQYINHKRLKLHVAASELYPDDYDFSIIFDSVEDRKARHSMERKHNPNLVIETRTDNNTRGE